MSTRRPRVLLLFPGPLFNVEEFLRHRLELLSEAFEGGVVTFGESASRVTMGRFEVVALEARRGHRLSSVQALIDAGMAVAAHAPRGAPPFDLVVTYDATKTGIAGWRLARRLGARFVVEMNGDCFAWANYADIRNPIKRALDRSAFILITAFVLSRADGVKLLFARQIKPFASLTRGAVTRRFPNFVDLSYFTNLGETKQILLAGFPFKVKGVDTLIDAFKRISQQHSDWRLSIIGFYPDPREILKAIDGHSRIELLRPVHRREVAKLIGACGIFALPSRTEGIARVLLEAAACGKPRVSTTVGGIPDVISDGVDGLLCAPEDSGTLSVLLARLMKDSELRARLGENAAARAKREFSEESYLAALRDFYGAVLASPTRHEHAR